jgi:uncharacterized protein GlcG (DUF336 family)
MRLERGEDVIFRQVVLTMFRRQRSRSTSGHKKPAGYDKVRQTRRRQIVPPELLEQRDAPSALACSLLPPAAASLVGDAGAIAAAADCAATSHAGAAKQTTDGLTRSGSASDQTTGNGSSAGSQSQSQQQAKATALASEQLLVPANVACATSTALSVRFPTVTDPLAANTGATGGPVNFGATAASVARVTGGAAATGGGGAPGGGGSAAPAAIRATAPASAAVPQLAKLQSAMAISASGPVITTDDVGKLLDRASAATPRKDAIIAVVDREGNILGVRVEDGVPIAKNDTATMVFAIDGAVSLARTAAFFSSDQAPLTSRTVRFISQSTVTQREVESNPNIPDPASTVRGPGFVAPIGVGGHFPPDVDNTPQVDLFAIEHTNRDSVIFPGVDGIKGTSDDINLGTRFGADFAAGENIPAPESYGYASGLMPNAQSRGIATLPGGIPLYKADASSKNTPKLVGGIGVFFPGPTGYATYEQNFQTTAARTAMHLADQTTNDRVNAPLVLEAEYSAYAAAGGVGTISGVPVPTGYSLPTGRIDLGGITLEIYGPHPSDAKALTNLGKKLGAGKVNGTNMRVTMTNPPPGGSLFLQGTPVPDGWLVTPHAAADGSLSVADVTKIINDGIAEANKVRAAIRLPIGQRTKMVLCVTDTQGNILGLYRMPDAAVFSIDVAVAKARNVAYYDDPTAIQKVDQVDANFDGKPEVPAGASFTNRTFRYLSTPFFPTGVTGSASGPFSILNDHTAGGSINPKTAENVGKPIPANQFKSVLGYDAFNPDTNFHELSDPKAVKGNQNGIVFFPGSTALYKNGKIVGGLGVSGDGVDEDDDVTSGAGGTFVPAVKSGILRADQVLVRGVRLPYFKFPRNPHG